ncbi:11024_t:CDS:2, partial [Dentiscutata heterogama]
VLLDGNLDVLVGVKHWKMFTDILQKGFYSLGCRKAGEKSLIVWVGG